MPASARTVVPPLRLVPRAGLLPARSLATSTPSGKDEQWPQRTPLGDYYAGMLRDPIPYPFSHKPEEPPSTADPSVLPPHKRPRMPRAPGPNRSETRSAACAGATPTSPPEPVPPPQTAQEKARIIFGSRLLGPAEHADRLASRRAESRYKAGVLVPPRPEQPDNCCMSGCVNCVWDRYREDMEEWTAREKEAQRRLKAGRRAVDAAGGGGSDSESNWKAPAAGGGKIAKDMWDEDVYENVPVGIREFMKQEKRLKERHVREGTIGG
ncbi:Oxidoreductase-lik [Metarhizium album ARSEF 1941]|uniref:Oxidoreductase-lik n=1 Tax=Metarhizium album (strain ARSEF 1941) TaxID=1081103 RepID=A0A0B2WZ97_METAS|nr:Oxidoreductase-lik [Metarhizium album ARSEF 1941]KHO01622.1 Oxidoreductase-lik [Metarhizium album ARSEF 1941]